MAEFHYECSPEGSGTRGKFCVSLRLLLHCSGLSVCSGIDLFLFFLSLDYFLVLCEIPTL